VSDQNDSEVSRIDALLIHHALVINPALYDEILDMAFDADLPNPFQVPVELNNQVKDVVKKFLKEKFENAE